MSEIYGYANAVSAGNSADELLGGIRRQIDAQNSLARDNFSKLRQGEKENKIVAQSNLDQTDVKDRADEGEEGGKVLSAVNDLTANKTDSSVDTSISSPEVDQISTENAPQSDGGNQNVSPDEGDTEIKGDIDLVREKTDFDSDRLFTTEGAGYDLSGNRGFGTGISTGRPLPSGEGGSNYVIRAYPVNEGRPAGVSEFINPLEDVSSRGSEALDTVRNAVKAGSISGAVKSLGTEGGGLLGKGVSGALKGATILTGGYDAVKDIADPKSFGKLDTADKVSNVANVISGGLESAGLAIGATGVGLPLAGVVEGLGLVSGAIGLGAGLIGDITGEKKQKAAVKAMPTISPAAKAPQQRLPAFESAFQGGQLIQ